MKAFASRLCTATATALVLGLAWAGAAQAECGIEKGSVRILSNDFEALRVVADAAAECASPTVTVTRNQTTEHKNLQVPALQINPAEYTVAVVANNSVVPLLNEGLIRPLDDLVAKYGQDLQPNQLIKIDGKVMAIAFMGNGQHLFLRKDILEQAGLQPPKSWEEVLAAAKVIKEKGLLEHPLAASMGAGWDLAAEFVNMYLGMGGEFFEPGSAEPAINNEKGVAALNMMKAITEFAPPNFLSTDSDELGKIYDGGQAAIVQQWGSRAGATIDPNGTGAQVADKTAFAPAPTVAGGTIPAAALWWDGFTIAKNISDEDAEASFRAMVHGIRPDVAAKNPNSAVWLIKGYVPGPAAEAVLANANAGAKPYPMLPYMGLLHTALGAELSEFLQGRESAEQALTDVEAAYRAAAKEAGFLN